MSWSLWLVRFFTDRIVSVHSFGFGVYCSKTVFPIIILMSSERSFTSATGLVSMCRPSRITVT